LQRGIIVIKDPEVAKLFADETRRQILHFLRHREMSATDLAKALGKSHSSIIHHLNLLIEAGLVEETRSEKVRNLVQNYYRSTAGRFVISYTLSEALSKEGEGPTWQESMLQRSLEGLEAFGIKVPEEKRERVKELLSLCFLREGKAFEESVEQQVEPVELQRPVQHAIVRLLTNIRLSQDREHSEAMEELRGLLGL